MAMVVSMKAHEAERRRGACRKANRSIDLISLSVTVDQATTKFDFRVFIDLFELMKTESLDTVIDELYSSGMEDWKLFPAYYRALARIILYRFSFLVNRP
ncbi:MAG: hypothetical protein WAW92_04745 [Minisyncoccia bacterium]